SAGIGPISIPFLGFGAKFLDYDNDGWPDIFINNGHVNPQVDGHSFGVTYAERPFLFHNLGNGKFSEIGREAGRGMAQRRVGRGAAVADFLNRGQQDIVATALDSSAVLLRNQNRTPNHWLRLKLVGTRSNRDAFGARVELKAGGAVQVQEARANSSFESASDPRLHFGLASADHFESISVRWPSGKVEAVPGQSADQELTLEEGKGIVHRQGSSPHIDRAAKNPFHGPKRTHINK
ncbi:MAG TPA: CRTAC1 family protein, partial [Terriglobales bacterium]